MISLIFLYFTAVSCNPLLNYESAREQFIKNEQLMSFGSRVRLSEAEKKADEVITHLKQAEIDYGFNNPGFFNLSKHWFTYKNDIGKSELYQIIKKMPKGGTLHVHDLSLLGPDYLMNLTYNKNEHLYICLAEDSLKFLHSKSVPISQCNTTWQLMSEARSSASNVAEFDAFIRSKLTLVIPNPESDTNIDIVWRRAINVWNTVTPLVSYTVIWEQFIYDALLDFKNDGCMYMELRSLLGPLYELNGSQHDEMFTAKIIKKAVDKFLKDHPDFFGVKLIYAPLRGVNVSTVQNYIKTCEALKLKYPDFFIGFDLTGQEDKGRPLKDFAPVLLEAQKNNIDFYFHAGETDWNGVTTDENVIDAVLLGTKRLGHGVALYLHPLALELVKVKNIGLEASVISNSLSLVDDLRNHPLATYFALDLPISISSDDPGLWESTAMTDDVYVAFVGISNRHAGLGLLKQLFINSLHYSALIDSEKRRALAHWEKQWNTFIENFNNET